MDLGRLRSETAFDHHCVEEAMPVMAPDLDQSSYVLILQCLYGFVKGWECWAESSSLDDIKELLLGRKRSSLLLADLLHFQAREPELIYEGPALSPLSMAHVLGAMYVMEGSTLGGQIIARHIESQFSLAPGVGDAYFRGYGDRTGSMWREFQTVLQQVPDESSESVIEAARALFADFGAWLTETCRQIPQERYPVARARVEYR